MNKFIPYIVAVITFITVSLTFFYPVLQDKKLMQSDIVQFTGSAKEIKDFRAEKDKEPYWTNTSFGGMPAYNVSAYYPNDFVRYLDKTIRFLPRPADYLFLYFVSFFTLLLVFKVEWKLAIVGALAFGFSTYYIIILGVGHNAKAHAIGYFPLVLSGIILTFRKRYLLGFLVTAIAMALEINASHPQMTYYLFFSVLLLGFFYLIDAIKKKKVKHLFTSVGILLIAVIIGIGVNATSLMATNHYAKDSTRSKSELTITPNGEPREKTTGLLKSEINNWSYGIAETFNLFIPRFMGGGNSEKLGESSKAYQLVKDRYGKEGAEYLFPNGNIPTYWGNQPGVSAPAYIGAIIIFLFVLGIFIVKNKYKKWLVATAILSILLSYGKNFSLFTDLFVDFVPLYNKFRAITSVQVLAEMAIPLLAILALKEFFSSKINNSQKIQYLKYSLYIIGGLALFFALLGTLIFEFEIPDDRILDKRLPGLSDAVISDRKSIFIWDSLRSLILIIVTGGFLLAFLKKKLNYNMTLLAIGVLIMFDLVQVNKRYLNADNFFDSRLVEKPFNASRVDQAIMKDKSHFRVLNMTVNPFNDGTTSYFHNSIGGYHAAKPRRFNELIEFEGNNIEVINMLNTKYFISLDEKENLIYDKNDQANGNVWFVQKLKKVNSANDEISLLSNLKTKEEAIYKANDLNLKSTYEKDSTAVIKLTKMDTVEFTYQSHAEKEQFAVFSEMYFKDWNAYIDGIEKPITRVNYVLRGLTIPAGKHKIVFKFEPNIVKKGNILTIISYLLLIIIPLLWCFIKRKRVV